MDSASPRPVLRDRSNSDGNTTRALMSGFIDHLAGGRPKLPLSPRPSTPGNADGNKYIGIGKAVTAASAAAAGDPDAASASPAVRIVTPESAQQGTDTSTPGYLGSSAAPVQITTVGVQQQQQQQLQQQQHLHVGDTATTTANTRASTATAAASAAASAAVGARALLDHGQPHHSSQRARGNGERP
ncbi:unnamed protein product, partial [Scytosiphon promiscuus]